MKTARRGQSALESLVHVSSEDGYALAGCCFEPTKSTDNTVIVWVHGVSLGFAEPEYVAIGRAAAALGATFLSVETRGHNFGAWLRGPGGMKLAGSAWEFLAEAPRDIGPWRRHAATLGATVVLVGHGWGAAKIVHDIAERGTDGLAGIVLASSASLVRDQLDPTLAAEADRLNQSGQGWQLLPWGTRPGMAPNTVSAQSYATRSRVHRELYGDGELRPALAKIDVPVLAWFGDAEGRAEGAIDGFFGAMRRNAVACPRFETTVLKDASYLYTGIEPMVAARLVQFARSTMSKADAELSV
ncbi:MAG TPA: alpha/beta hydrolase [Kaistia sp.]|nr:alpha/beta hydrolase [Kaistia sp.]